MKTLTIIITITFTFYLAQAQVQEKSYDDIIYLGLPSNLYKPSNNELTDFLNSRKELRVNLEIKKDIFFTNGEILVSVSAFKGVVSNNFLMETKKFRDYMNEQGLGNINYVSEMKTTNNISILTVQSDHRTSFGSYDIFASNIVNNKRAFIGIKYKLKDKAAAEKIAETILANLRFVEKPIIRQR